jgi:hypothetical protein
MAVGAATTDGSPLGAGGLAPPPPQKTAANTSTGICDCSKYNTDLTSARKSLNRLRPGTFAEQRPQRPDLNHQILLAGQIRYLDRLVFTVGAHCATHSMPFFRH